MERNELQVKYNILRGDYYRASKRLEYFESGKAFEKERKAHEKQIHSLEYRLNRAESDYKKLYAKNNENIREINRLHSVIAEKASEAEDLEKEYQKTLDEYKQLIEEMRKEIDTLKGTIKKMTAQLNRDYTNSSVPSSKDENHKKIAKELSRNKLIIC